MDEILKETHHDVTAFLNTVAESLGEESRYIHLGMTSSDVMDTALSLQLIEASDILAADIKELTFMIWPGLAMKYKNTPHDRPYSRRSCGTDYFWAKIGALVRGNESQP